MSAYGFLAVGVGASLGAWLRWWIGVLLNPLLPLLPLGTLTANLVGGYFIGMAVEYLQHQANLPAEVRLFIITGFLGGLTTFSTFSAEAVTLLARAQFGWAAALIAGHVTGSLTMTVFGIYSIRWLRF